MGRLIMSGNHPNLILAGTKTMTRRVIKAPAGMKKSEFDFSRGWADLSISPKLHVPIKLKDEPDWSDERWWRIYSPYQVGDRLIIKETWATENQYNHLKPSEIPRTATIYYLASIDYDPFTMGKVRSSRFMCLWMSRISLEITELWAELLRSISPTDALAEGGYTVEEFIKLYLKINHLPDDADPWNWAIKYKLLGD